MRTRVCKLGWSLQVEQDESIKEGSPASEDNDNNTEEQAPARAQVS